MLSIGDSKVSKLYLGDMECKKAYLGDTLIFGSTPAKPSGLPSNYTKVEYIKFDYSSGVDTGLYVTPATTKIELDMEVDDSYWGQFEAIVSTGWSRAGQSSGKDYTLWIRRNSETTIQSFADADIQNSAAPIWETANVAITGKRITLNYDGPSKKLEIGDTSISITAINYEVYDHTLHLGMYHLYPLTSMPYKLYSAKIYTPSLARDFVPCISSTGVIGLYDLIGGKFYENVNIGKFTAGPAA